MSSFDPATFDREQKTKAVPPITPVVIRMMLSIQDKGGSSEVPKGKPGSSTRKHMRTAVANGFGEIKEGVFLLVKKIASPALCKCGERFHITSSGVTCPKCRNGIRPVDRKERRTLRMVGATWSESLLDRR